MDDKAPRATVQTFAVSHLNSKDFKADGLRSYALYRDLGFVEATNGLARAHVIKFIPPRPKEAQIHHFHAVTFQMVYVLKGWIETEFDGQGRHVMREGSSWIQPPGIVHAVLNYSDDCEVLEVILPADFETVTVPR
jgi:uncharacterized cupin superfamily protein